MTNGMFCEHASTIIILRLQFIVGTILSLIKAFHAKILNDDKPD